MNHKKKKNNKYSPYVFDLLNDTQISSEELQNSDSLEETSTMAGGGVMGSPWVNFTREEFVKEFKEKKLKNFVQERIKKVFESQKKSEENMLREYIKKILTEVKSEIANNPHENTAINILTDLLKSIIPTIETDYKTLTSDAEQRKSFRVHIINAVSNTIEQLEVNKDAKTKEISINEKINVNVDEDGIDDIEDEKFINIDDKSEKDADAEALDSFSVPGEDETGRNMALQTYGSIETQISDAFAILENENDKRIFNDYLITNLKLYFDKFEEELVGQISEPTTEEYEDTKINPENGTEV